MTARHILTMLILPLFAITASAKPYTPRTLLEAAARGDTLEQCALEGVTAYVSTLRPGYILLTPQANPNTRGIEVKMPESAPQIELGDILHIEGKTVSENHRIIFEARLVEKIRNISLPKPNGAKQADFRKGLLVDRVITLHGSVSNITTEYGEDGGAVTHMGLLMDKYTAYIHIPGALNADKYIGEPVRIKGLARSKYGVNGMFLASDLESAGEDDIKMMRNEAVAQVIYGVVLTAAIAILVLAVIFFLIYRRSRIKAREYELVAAERRRMAADLHDTIEQHLAGANLLAAGVLALDDVPPDVVEAMKTLSGLLANAKTEVRSAVMNLRMEGSEDRSLESEIESILRDVAKTGVKTRRLLRGLPENLSVGAKQDLVMIAREAVTNAIKHGKAKTIVATADPREEGGFMLTISNDGEPFDVTQSLGPESGHYGLAGMKQRALRNHFEIELRTEGRWTQTRIEVKI